MPNPTPYSRDYSFQDRQAAAPKDQPPGVQLDNEFDNVSNAMAGVAAAVEDVRRSDGKLNDAVVTLESLTPEVKAVIEGDAVVLPMASLTVKANNTNVSAVPQDVPLSALVGPDNPVGAGIRTLRAEPQIRSPILMPGRDFGLPIGGGVGTAAAINAVILGAGGASIGRHVLLPPENLMLDGAILNGVQNVTVEGIGGCSTFHNAGNNDRPACRLILMPGGSFNPRGLAYGAALQHYTPPSATSVRMEGGGFSGITVDGNGAPNTRGFHAFARLKAKWDLAIISTQADTAVQIEAGRPGIDCAEDAGVQKCWMRFEVRQVDGTIEANTHCVTFDGPILSNVSINPWCEFDLLHKNGNGFLGISADTNYMIFRSTRVSGGTGAAIYQRGKTSTKYGCDSMKWGLIGCNAPIILERADGANILADAGGRCDFSELGNGTPYPLDQFGQPVKRSQWDCLDNYYRMLNPTMIQAAICAGRTLQESAAADALMGNLDTQVLYNTFGGSLSKMADDQGNIWAYRFNPTTKNLELVRLGGAGYLNLPDVTALNGKPITLGAADSGGAGFRILRVPN